MTKRISLVAVTLLSFALLIANLAFAQQGSQPPSTSSRGATTGKTSAPHPRRGSHPGTAGPIPLIERDLDEALQVVQSNYIDGRKLDYNRLFKSSIDGMLRSLDPHSNYFDREEFEELKNDQRPEYFGIGASIQSYTVGDQADTFITSTFENSPAARAGLRFGDKILAVDGVRMTGRPSVEVRDKIRGPRGSSVKIEVERVSDRSVRTDEIVRDAVPQPSIPDVFEVKPGVGYVDMTRGFNLATAAELEAAMSRLHARGVNSVILDLRRNPGGFLDQAILVAENFLPAGQLILTQRGRNGQRDNSFESRNSRPDLTPLVILISGETASASEIVAGAMQDHDRALIVGETSFGKGLVQSIFPLEYGSGLTLTTAKYFTPSGRLIQRDYSNGSLYDYYKHDNPTRSTRKETGSKPLEVEKRTDSGRTVYGGGGITPDELVGSKEITLSQQRLFNPLFAFARELAGGRVSGFESYKSSTQIDFRHELQPTDYLVSDGLFKSLESFVASDASFKSLSSTIARNRSFVELYLRFYLVTAAYGRTMADRVFVTTNDPQMAKAFDVLPRARDLAMATGRLRAQP